MPTTRSQPMPMIGGIKSSSTYFATGTPGGGVGSGPTGQAAMTFFQVCRSRLATVSGRMLGINRTNGTTGGWGIYEASNLWYATVWGSAAPVQVSVNPVSYQGAAGLYLLIVNARVAAGPTLQVRFWLNGVLGGTASGGNGGFTSYPGPVSIGCFSSNATFGANAFNFGDCGVLYNYDPDAYSSSYGSGATGLTAQWWDDLNNGRYLTWPRSGVANTDWYWAARDVVDPSVVKPTWTDRYTGTAMTRTGNLQPAMMKGLL